MNYIASISARIVCFLTLFALSSIVSSAQSSNPLTDNKPHEGVSSCYGSTCHSRQEATGIVVRQNEVLTWQDDTSTMGAHYRAYKSLETERSAAIVARLGLDTPATEAKECLSCHAAGIAPALRGPKFHLDDGVGCESCHGAAGDWLSSHYQTGRKPQSQCGCGIISFGRP